MPIFETTVRCSFIILTPAEFNNKFGGNGFSDLSIDIKHQSWLGQGTLNEVEG